MAFWVARTMKFMKHNNWYAGVIGYKVHSEGKNENSLLSVSLEIEALLLKYLQANQHDANRIRILQALKSTYKADQYSFSFPFVESLLQLSFTPKHFSTPQNHLHFLGTYWKLVYAIYRSFFTLLFNAEKMKRLYNYDGVFENDDGEVELITRIGNLKRNAKQLLPLFNVL